MRIGSKARRSLLAAALLISLGVPAQAQDTYMRLKIGEKAPDFRLREVTSGRMVSLRDYAGSKVVMVEFWATWCEICKREMPSLVRLYAGWKDKGFELLSVVLPSGNVDDIRRIVRENRINYPVLLDADLSVATKSFGLAGPIPLKVMIDHKGIIRYTHVGDYARRDDELRFVLEGLIKEMEKGK